MVFWVYVQEWDSWIIWHSVFSFIRTSILFSTVAVPISKQCRRAPFSSHLQDLLLIDFSHGDSGGYEVIYFIIFLICISLIITGYWASFDVFCWPSVCSLEKCHPDRLPIKTFKKFIYLVSYFLPHWVFCCCMQAFFSCTKQGLLCGCSARAYYRGFLLWSMASRVHGVQ